MSDSLRPHELQHVRPPCPSPTPRVHSNSHPSSPWCHPAISSSVITFSSCPLCWISVALYRLPLVAESGSLFSSQCLGFSLTWFLSLPNTGTKHVGFSSFGMLASNCSLQAGTKDWTRVPCIGRQIPIHWVTREVLYYSSLDTATYILNFLWCP